MNLIAQSNFGTCARCGDKDTACRRRKKDFVCLPCCKKEDTEKQVAKANLRNSVRGLNGRQKEMGLTDMASRAALIQDIDFFYSRYLRIKEADQYGNIRCYICGSNKAWSLCHVMHFIPRACISLRFDHKNTRCGCYHCNVTLNGNLVEYAKKLEEEEKGLPELLTEISREVSKPTLDELKGLLLEYKQKLKLVELKFKK